MGKATRWRALFAAMVVAASCGGGDDGGGTGEPVVDTPTFAPSSYYAARCAMPRSGTDPATGAPYPDVQGTAEDEKLWLRSWTSELYLWYREVWYADPASFAAPADYFEALKTNAHTASGRAKDRFHFTYPTATWVALSRTGVEAGYGAQWAVIASTPPRQVVVAYVEPGSPAEAQGIARGAQVLEVDGVDVEDGADVDALNAGLLPAGAGETHAFSILDMGGTSPRAVTLTSEDVQSAPVQDVETLAGGTVGYMLFNDNLARAEAALVAAVDELEAAGVTDLVLDIRYNGGGYVEIAGELAYMIAGPERTSGRTFERSSFNDRYAGLNPVLGGPLVPFPFQDATLGFSTELAAGEPLPHLDLPRVFVLTGPGTCSASESIINGLRGVDVDVIQVGSTTCGKPYGFYPADDCGTTYFSIQFQGVNAKGFGDYGDGFEPGGTGAAGLPGCSVPDDFTHDLGDPEEARLAAALHYLETGACPAAGSSQALTAARPALSAVDGELPRGPWRENRIFRGW
jgi:carboxyl-terminal processing protease